MNLIVLSCNDAFTYFASFIILFRLLLTVFRDRFWLFTDALVKDIDEKTFCSDVIGNKGLDSSKVSLCQIFHKLGTFERFLYLFEDATWTGSYLLEFAY